MNKHLPKILFFLICTIFFAAAYYAENEFYQQNDQKINVETFQNTLYRKEDELNKILEKLGEKLHVADFKEVLSETGRFLEQSKG